MPAAGADLAALAGVLGVRGLRRTFGTPRPLTPAGARHHHQLHAFATAFNGSSGLHEGGSDRDETAADESEPVPWAVIPAAGRGTRLMPATAVVPKVLLPVGTRPMLHWALEEALDAVGRGVIIVVSPRQPLVREYLETAVAVAEGSMQADDARDGWEELEDLGRRLREVELHVVEQPEPTGIGDAFVRCRPITGSEDFGVLLPDNWFAGRRRCLAQMLPTFRRHGCATMALVRVEPDEAGRLGNVGGVRLERLGGRAYRVLELQDKKDGTFEGVTEGPELRGCGRYLVTPEFYAALEATGPPEEGEWDDVPAFQHLIATGRVVGHRVEAGHFDLGQPGGYAAASACLSAAGSDAAGR